MPRKSDTARRSDVVMAKVALAEGDATDSDAPVASAASGGIPLAPAPPPASIEMDAERGSESAAPGDKRDKDSATIEELNLPKSIITRLAKGVLPPNTQIQANAILAMSKAATVFISHLANAANEITTSSGKKTIMPQDVFDSLDEIEFPEFREVIQAEFKKFNEIQTTKRNTYRRRVAAAKKGVPYVEPSAPSSTADGETQFIADPAAAAYIDTARSIKKQRPNGPADVSQGSAMDVDVGDNTEEFQDAETEPEQENDEDDEDEPEQEEEEEEDEEDEGGEDEMHDALEERDHGGEGEDEALDNGEDSDS